MDLDLVGKTALVAGASAGIGRAVAVALAAEGVRLAIAARRLDELNALAETIRKSGAPAPIPFDIDIMQAGAPEALARRAREALGRVDILVNSIGGGRAVKIDSPDEKWEEGMTINFTRLRQLTHALLPGMIERGWGRIISVTGRSEPDHLNVAYAAKAAIHGWAKSLSREVAPFGVTVNCVPPGKILTEQTLRNYSDEERARVAREIPTGRFGQPEELANLVVFLASPKAQYITGTVIPVDGGFRRYAF